MSRSGRRILRRTITRNGRSLLAGTSLIGVHQACEAAIPILIGVIVDTAVAPGDATALVLWTGALGLLFAVLTSAWRFGARRLMGAIAAEAHRLRVEVAARILHPRGVQTDMRAGDLLTVSTSDADNTAYLLDYVPRIVGALVATGVSATTLLLISVPLGIAVLVATPLVLLVLHVGAPRITKQVAEQQAQAGRATSLAADLVTGLRPLRGVGAQEAAAERYRGVSRQSLAATLRATRTQSGYLAASTILSTLLACGIAILAGWFALTGRISVGQFITVIGSAQFLIEPFGLLAIVPGWIAEARASADRVAQVTDAGLVLPAGVTTPDGPGGELRLSGVRHGSLAGLDLHVRPGEFVGIVARRPADAETLVKLLGLPADHEGTILVGGVPVAEIDRSKARRLLLVEPHHTDLFTGTIAANVAVHDDRGGLPEALSAAAADEVVNTRPAGLDELVAERGATLSGGQRQRLALARALLARPPILVLHDPTTAVDAVTEHTIAQGIRALRHGPGSDFATVVLTSSPALLAATDRVVVLDDGVVTAEGTHADLGDIDAYRQLVLR
ncbi:ABC transporter ATP-binding protein [Actinoplanes sp. NPDC051859]|uniref:ABC transporter ATP-binding protein n=1 Tax=Actinoplanes sp. NPDC051859 TaxID=3363909 RepID=UPI0037A39276